MKSKLLIIGALCAFSLTTNAQTKGTSAVSFGVNTNSQENKQTNTMGSGNTSTTKSNAFSLGYGYFLKDNEKISLEFNYGTNKTQYEPSQIQELVNYGANISYQNIIHYLKNCLPTLVETLPTLMVNKSNQTVCKSVLTRMNIAQERLAV